jgi:Icc protein
MIKLLQFTDTHLYQDETGKLKGTNTQASMQACIDHAHSHHTADAILLTGDMTHDASPEAYHRMNKAFSVFEVPVGVIPGNHDLASVMYQEADPAFATDKIELDNWIIVLLNSAVPGHEHGLLEKDELNRCQELLTEYKHHHAMICLHHQPVPVGSRWLDTMQLQNCEEFLGMVKNNENVKAVVWGHVHQSFRTDYAGIPFIATPSTCIQFKPDSNQFALDSKTPGYRWFELKQNGQLETGVEFIEYDLELDESARY